MLLEDYLTQYSRVECIELGSLIHRGDGTMRNTVISLINKHKLDKDDKDFHKVVKRYDKLCKLEMDADFDILMDEYKKLEWQMGPLNCVQETPPKKKPKRIQTERRS